MASELILPAAITMEQVKEQFAHWRQTRPKKRSKTPEPLWEAVRCLVKEKGYTFVQISTQLRLSYRQLRSNIGPQPTRSNSLTAPSSFVKVEPPPFPFFSPQPPSLDQSSYSGSFELTRPDGTLLKASGLNHKDLHSLVQRFLS
jgi:hypothetical protein